MKVFDVLESKAAGDEDLRKVTLLTSKNLAGGVRQLFIKGLERASKVVFARPKLAITLFTSNNIK
ncbi:MAG: hypothetical protein F7B17_03120 [Desulfurococcales archaeon]|nr:hypothetical protein [Desulfurococcales archaeon]